MNYEYDAIVIGTGQAGPALTARMAREGWKVGVVERHLVGGTCVNVGCVPTKTLVASARAAWVARNAADWGVRVEGAVRVDLKAVKARKDEVVRSSNQGVTKWIEGLEGVRLHRGHARFEARNAVRVGEDLLTARRIFLNVGARALVPDLPGLSDAPYLTNTGMMELGTLPEHLIVIGAGYIGLEFAQMYRRFGSRVTVIHRGRHVLAREDDDVAEAVRTILEAEGVEFRMGSALERVEPADAGVAVYAGGDAIAGSHLLVAVGRRPNTDDLGLERAGVQTDERGYVAVNDRLETTAEGIWALGDCNGRGAFTHTAWNDHEIVAANLFDKARRKVGDRIPCYAVFIDPPLGRAGLTEREVRESGRKALVARMPMRRVGRARERGETRGFMKILVDADSERILGASLLGIEGDEVIHVLLDLMYADAPYTVLRNAMHIHPTVSELLPTLVGELAPLG